MKNIFAHKEASADERLGQTMMAILFLAGLVGLVILGVQQTWFAPVDVVRANMVGLATFVAYVLYILLLQLTSIRTLKERVKKLESVA